MSLPQLVSAAFVAANLLSMTRIGLAIWFPFAPEGWRLGIVAAAVLSDIFDGPLSRRFHATSSFGQLLDPIADKLFVLTVLLTILWEGLVQPWELALVISRDLAILAGALWVALRTGWAGLQTLPPSILGKVATGFQFVFLLSVLYYGAVIPAFFVPTAAASLLAGADYLRKYRKVEEQPAPVLSVDGDDEDATAQL